MTVILVKEPYSFMYNWCSASTWGPGWWSGRTLQCLLGSQPPYRWTHPNQWGRCHPQTLGAWWTDDRGCSCWCTGRRAEGKEHRLEKSESETCFPSFMCCLLLDRKSVIHLQVESGTLNWESLSCSRAVLTSNLPPLIHHLWPIPPLTYCS